MPTRRGARVRIVFQRRSGEALKTHRISCELEIPLPMEPVFAFFSKAENLERITPPELRFEIASPKPVGIFEGAIIDYRLRLYGIAFGWRTRILEWRPQERFLDEQVAGPYRLWRHRHEFEAVRERTVVRDRVTYALPFFPLGELVFPAVRSQLKRIFCFRQAKVIECLEQDPRACNWRVNCI